MGGMAERTARTSRPSPLSTSLQAPERGPPPSPTSGRRSWETAQLRERLQPWTKRPLPPRPGAPGAPCVGPEHASGLRAPQDLLPNRIYLFIFPPGDKQCARRRRAQRQEKKKAVYTPFRCRSPGRPFPSQPGRARLGSPQPRFSRAQPPRDPPPRGRPGTRSPGGPQPPVGGRLRFACDIQPRAFQGYFSVTTEMPTVFRN